jgi:hypothetical protein
MSSKSKENTTGRQARFETESHFPDTNVSATPMEFKTIRADARLKELREHRAFGEVASEKAFHARLGEHPGSARDVQRS